MEAVRAKANRGKYNRDGQRYPSDLMDAERAYVEPLIPPAKHDGRRCEVDLREVVNDLLYVLGTGCQWQIVPKGLPLKRTLFSYFGLWDWDGTLGRLHEELNVKCRDAAGRQASSMATIIDSQSVKWAKKETLHRPMRARRSRARRGISLSIR